jgi:hypothetical protein
VHFAAVLAALCLRECELVDAVIACWKQRPGIELNTNEARSGWKVDGSIVVARPNAVCAPTVDVVTVVVF